MIQSLFSAKKEIVLTLKERGYNQYEIAYYLSHYDIDVLLNMFNINYTDNNYVSLWYSKKNAV